MRRRTNGSVLQPDAAATVGWTPKCARSDINRYCQNHSRYCHSNYPSLATLFIIILSLDFPRYLAKYIAKPEPSVKVRPRGEVTPVTQYLEERFVGAAEAVLSALGYNTFRSSCGVIFLDTNLSVYRRRALKPEEQQRQAVEKSTEEDVYIDGAREKYMQRPAELEDVLYTQYFSQYEVLPASKKEPQKRAQEFGTLIDLKQRRVLKRNKPLVCRTRFLTPVNGEGK